MLDVEHTDQRGRVAVGSGQNVLEAEKFTSLLSRKLSKYRTMVTTKRE